jgi:DNA gyrase subunit A
VRGISRHGRPAQGVRVMNLREDDQVSAVALVMETTTDTSAAVQEGLEEAQPGEPVTPEPADAPDVPAED